MQIDWYFLAAVIIGVTGGVALLTALVLDLRGESASKRSKQGLPGSRRHQAGAPTLSDYEKAGKGA